MKNGYTGLSFPLRLNNRGGLAMSTTTVNSPDHIKESIAQIVLTRLKERVMELDVGSKCESALFMPNDLSTQAILQYDIVDALTRLEPRIIVSEDDVIIVSYENIMLAQINFIIKEYGTSYSQILPIGEVR